MSLPNESICRMIYSKKTDVWALGVLLYEIWTLAMIPYYLISDDREVARMVVNGERLQQPQLSGSCVCHHAGMLADDPQGQAERV